jgi:hypothetical protein
MDYSCSILNMLEIELSSDKVYKFPFTEVEVYCSFKSPSGKSYNAMFFYNGNNTWKCRFTPNEAGEWSYNTYSINKEDCFLKSGKISVTNEESKSRGMLRTDVESGWGLKYESGEEFLLVGDTMYHIFGVEYCGLNVREILEMRKRQGFNSIRARIPISPYCTGDMYNVWQNKSIWLWGGSPQCPEYEFFNLDYFAAIDRVMKLLEELDMGVEIILEGWMFEIPFSDRQNFTPEFEELYIRYTVARLSAYKSLYMWCPANEYNYYGKDSNRAWCWRLEHPTIKYLGNKFLIRLSKMIKDADPHKHPVGAHNAVVYEPFKEYFRNNKEIDILLYQYWGDTSSIKATVLASGIDEELKKNIIGSGKVNILAEYGYEGYPNTGLSKPPHDNIYSGHTRRGAYKALFMGMHFVAGFENTWGLQFCLEPDAKGASEIIHAKRLFTEIIKFNEFAPKFDLLDEEFEANKEQGTKSLCLSNKKEDIVLIYLPVGGESCLNISYLDMKKAYLFDTISGEMRETDQFEIRDDKTVVLAPIELDDDGYSKDWVIIIHIDNQL